MDKIKQICLLGASGSIGRQTIDVVINYPDRFLITAISVGENLSNLKGDIDLLQPQMICVKNEMDCLTWQELYPDIKFFWGDNGLIELVKSADYELLVNALVGFVGLQPTIEAIKQSKDIALANKETLVVAGGLVNRLIDQYSVTLVPIDSEHSAIFQCMQGADWRDVEKVIITASGGSFRDYERNQLDGVTKHQALSHPNWSMGAKITIDSATMMNKAFEIIEAHYLFGLRPDQIETILHPQSIVHSLVQFKDSSLLAQLGTPDMREPIQFALTYPRKLPIAGSHALSLSKLDFRPLDNKRYPLIDLAYRVMEDKGNAGCILNAANEECVRAFLNDEISFLDIEEIVLNIYEVTPKQEVNGLEELIACDQSVRKAVRELLKGKICQ